MVHFQQRLCSTMVVLPDLNYWHRPMVIFDMIHFKGIFSVENVDGLNHGLLMPNEDSRRGHTVGRKKGTFELFVAR